MALAYLAQRERGSPSAAGYCCVRDIVAELRLPPRLVAEILKELGRARLVQAMRGPRGGYRLARPAAQLPLLDVVHALEGERLIADCTGGGRCEWEAVCAIQSGMHELTQRIQRVFHEMSVADLTAAPAPSAPQPLAPPPRRSSAMRAR